MNFASNVVASIVSAILIVLVSGLLSRRARGLFVTIIAKTLGVDIEHVYRNKQAALPDIEDELRRARHIALLTGRGNELQRGLLADLLNGRIGHRPQSFRLVLPSLKVTEGAVDWIECREKELAKTDLVYKDANTLRHQIAANLRYLQAARREGVIEVKQYNLPHVFRILITDRVVFFTPYTKHRHGGDTETIKFRRGGPMYEHFARLFDCLWDEAEVAPLDSTMTDHKAE